MRYSIYWFILVICWGVFILIWLVGWVYNLTKGPKTLTRSTYTPIWVIGGILAYAIIHLGLLKSLNLVGSSPLWVKGLGIFFLLPSTALTFWARFSLGTMWSDRPEAKIGHQLRTGGPYHITRHPIYTGTIGMLFGSLLISGMGYWILLTLIGVSVVLFKVPAEEKLMMETFGDQYQQYRRNVPRIIPGMQFLKKIFVSRRFTNN